MSGIALTLRALHDCERALEKDLLATAERLLEQLTELAQTDESFAALGRMVYASGVPANVVAVNGALTRAAKNTGKPPACTLPVSAPSARSVTLASR